MPATDFAKQQPCSHCGECARVCLDRLDPEALFFRLVHDDFDAARAGRLDACRECNLCVEVCPSHIPLLDWFRWGKSELAFRERADAARARYLRRNARVAAGRTPQAATPGATRAAAATATSPRTISRAEVLAAIARGRRHRARTQCP